MTNLKKLSAILIATGLAFSGAAFAGDTAFIGADVNTDGSLDRDEFLVFVSIKADEGEASFSAVRDAGSYDTAFATMDTDGDGKLSHEEAVTTMAEEKPTMGNDEDWQEPELETPEE